jgi:hypothetical protein
MWDIKQLPLKGYRRLIVEHKENETWDTALFSQPLP